ncbi:MAG: phosphoribosylformylglycinamidine cyclo-ligase [Ignavibacteria bacterium RBG_16_34_14]|nr:MAG: phosphoribosylformylglycinamidine cyclo-ligase [Ignavibacteria bacterium RBG_16_34_14]
MDNTYKSAGVDIDAGDETVTRIKKFAKSTFNKNVLSDIGFFGAFYNLNLSEYSDPVLVSSVDGVGTKLKIAFIMNTHNTVGQDLVNHCVNDIAVCGAQPLFFLDYLAFEKLNTDVASSIIEGFSVACKENGCALIGGETAEMPGFYNEKEYDMSGTIVGIVDKKNIIGGKSIKKGDILIGFKSNGLHTNGYSLARKVLLSKFKPEEKIPELNSTLGKELLRVHKSYLKLINALREKVEVKGLSHITGGGIVGNTIRILPKGLTLKILWDSWNVLPIFNLIQKTGKIPDEEMRKVFNLGIGLISIVSEENQNEVIKIASKLGEKSYLIGKVE